MGFDFPFPFFYQWYEYQKQYVNAFDVTAHVDAPLFRDTARLSRVLLYKRKQLLRAQAAFALYGDRVVIDEGTEEELVLLFDRVSAASVLGRNKLNLYHEDTVYQVKGSKRFNALKYVNLFFRYNNMKKGDENAEFLGL